VENSTSLPLLQQRLRRLCSSPRQGKLSKVLRNLKDTVAESVRTVETVQNSAIETVQNSSSLTLFQQLSLTPFQQRLKDGCPHLRWSFRLLFCWTGRSAPFEFIFFKKRAMLSKRKAPPQGHQFVACLSKQQRKQRRNRRNAFTIN